MCILPNNFKTGKYEGYEIFCMGTRLAWECWREGQFTNLLRLSANNDTTYLI